MWRMPKVPNGLSKYFDQWGETDLRDMIRRDRNHPSVIMWSIGNEIPGAGPRPTAAQDRQAPHRHLPRGRPARAPPPPPCNNLAGRHRNGLADAVRPVRASTTSRCSTRRYIQRDHPDVDHLRLRDRFVRSARAASIIFRSRSTGGTPSLQYPAMTSSRRPGPICRTSSSRRQDEFPNVLGEFVWTGFDYLGEPTPFGRAPPTGRRAAPTSASWTWPASPRIAITSTRASGPASPWCTCCRTGTGRAAKGRRSRSWPTPTPTRWSCS